jgi:hypothetical protein
MDGMGWGPGELKLVLVFWVQRVQGKEGEGTHRLL